MRTSGQRIDAHEANYATATVGLKVAAQLAPMKARFGVATGQLAYIEIKIQGILNDSGIATIQYPFYLSFGREMWALGFQGIHGATLLARATGLHTKYVSYGLTTAIVKRIALDVFNATIV
jgi:hypothetical protein